MNSYNGFSGSQRSRAARLAKGGGLFPRDSDTRCHACGQIHTLEYHSEDYTILPRGQTLEGLKVGPWVGEWCLCYRCHRMLHVKHRNPPAWDRYRLAVRQGFRFAPCNWGGVLRMINWRAEEWEPEPEKLPIRRLTMLDDAHDGLLFPSRLRVPRDPYRHERAGVSGHFA